MFSAQLFNESVLFLQYTFCFSSVFFFFTSWTLWTPQTENIFMLTTAVRLNVTFLTVWLSAFLLPHARPEILLLTLKGTFFFFFTIMSSETLITHQFSQFTAFCSYIIYTQMDFKWVVQYRCGRVLLSICLKKASLYPAAHLILDILASAIWLCGF